MKRLLSTFLVLLVIICSFSLGNITIFAENNSASAFQSNVPGVNFVHYPPTDDVLMSSENNNAPAFSEDRVIVRLKKAKPGTLFGNEICSREDTNILETLPALNSLDIESVKRLNPKASLPKLAQTSDVSLFGSGIDENSSEDEIYLLTLKNKGAREVLSACSVLKTQPEIETAEPDYILKINTVPNDTYYSRLYGMEKISAPQAWDVVPDCSSVVVGIIDTGIDYNHIDLASNIWTNPNEIPNNGVDDDKNGYIDDIHGWNFINNTNNMMDDNGHGTHVAGTIGAVGNNNIGVVGVAWNVKLAGLKFLDMSGSGYTSAAISAVSYANMMGFNVTNNSYGGDGYSEIFKSVIASGNEVFVAAAGNSSTNNDYMGTYPTNYDCPNVISVAATDSNDHIASFSNYGINSVDIAAPGVDIYSTAPGNEYQLMSGTSMASPHVAGAAAVVKAMNPDLTPAEIIERMTFNGNMKTEFDRKLISSSSLNVFKALSPVVQIPIQNISFDKTELSLRLRENYILTTSFMPVDTTYRRLRWESSDTNVATVSAIGKVIAVSDGTATITAYSQYDETIKAECTATVYGNALKVNFEDMNFKQAVIDNLKNYKPRNADDDPFLYYNYTINSNIFIDDVQKLDELHINDEKIKSLSGIEHFTMLTELDCSYNELATLDLSALTNLQKLNCSNNLLTELSFNENTAWKNFIINNNYLDINSLLTKVSIVDAKADECIFQPQLVYKPVNEISLNRQTLNLRTNKTAKLYYTINPADATNKNIIWSSSNSDVVSISDDGGIVARSAGSAVITVTSIADSSKKAICTVTVSDQSTKPIEFADMNFKSDVISTLKSISTVYSSYTVNSDLYQADLDNITELSIYNTEITDMTEIAYFTSLRYLQIERTKVTTLDLSQLKMLLSFYFRGSEIQNLDLSNLPLLSDVTVYTAELSDITLQGSVNLQELTIQGSKLTSLDLSGLTELTALYCQENRLTALNICDSTELRTLSCHFNFLESLDLKDFVNLTNLSCDNNKLRNLVISPEAPWNVIYCGNNFLDISSGSEFMKTIDEIQKKPYDVIDYLPQLPIPEKPPLEFTNPVIELIIGNTEMLKPKFNYEYVTDKNLVFSSDDTSIATVDEFGIITTVGFGSTTVKAALLNNPSVFTVGTVIVRNFNENGTPDNPFILRTKEDVLRLSALSRSEDLNTSEEYLNAYYKLDPENGYYIDMEGIPFDPIGLGVLDGYSGVFDGNNKEMRNLYINESISDYQGNKNITIGLFSWLNGGQVKNLVIYNAKVIANYYMQGDSPGVGIIAGEALNGSEINNSNTFGTAECNTYSKVGGLVGRLASDSSIMNCSAHADVSGYQYVGGLAGDVSYNCRVYNSYTTGNVNGDSSVGGAIGTTYKFLTEDTCYITNCYATGSVKGVSDVGGFIGQTEDAEISYCYAVGNVSAGRTLGAFAGISMESKINNCYATGDVTSDILDSKKNVGYFCGATWYGTNTNTYKFDGQIVIGETTNNPKMPSLSYSDLKDSARIITLLGSAFRFDGNVSGCHPKLYQKDKTELVPYQLDTYLPLLVETTGIHDYSIFDADKNSIDVSITLTKTDELEGKKIISAVYYPNGTVANVSCFDIMSEKQEYKITVPLNALISKETYGVYTQKIMVWDNLNSIMPLGITGTNHEIYGRYNNSM